jgi:hypothetical protein
MIDRQERRNAIVTGLVVGLLLGCLAGLPFYESVKSYMDHTRAVITWWEPENDCSTQYRIYRILTSPAPVATVWLLAWGLAGAAIGRYTRTEVKRT